MSWRIHQNEKDFKDATLIAWEIVLPHRHVPILDSERAKVKKIEEKLTEMFTTYELHVAGKRLKEKLKL